MKRLLGVLFIVAVFTSVASANIELMLSTGGNSVTIGNNGTIISQTGAVGGSSLLVGPGAIEFAGSIGGYTINVTTGSGTPAQPNAQLDLNSINIASGATAPLTIQFSETNITPGYPGWDMGIGGTMGFGAITYTAYEDNNNNFFGTSGPGTTLIGTLGPFTGAFCAGQGSCIGSPGAASSVNAIPLYSLTQVLQMTATGPGTYSGNATLVPMPEPMGVVLFGTVLVLSVSRLRRRRSS